VEWQFDTRARGHISFLHLLIWNLKFNNKYKPYVIIRWNQSP